MDEKKIEKNIVAKYSFIYASVLILSNLLGSLLPMTSKLPVNEAIFLEGWMNFINSHHTLIVFIQIFSFVIPTVCCISYLRFAKNAEVQTKRFINLPIAYSALGTLGWIFYFLFEVFIMIYVKIIYKDALHITPILFSSFLYVSQEGLFIFTFAFLIINAIHRKFVLPKFFPDGNLSRYKITFRPSEKFLFVIFYISIGIFPIFFLYENIMSMQNNYNIPANKDIFIVLMFIVTFGIIILVTFTRYFSSPLKKLKEGTEKVKAGNFQDKVDIISNDSFGDLADTFNEMIDSLDQKTRKIYEIQDSVIRGMAVMVESRDNSTGGHINRTSDCVKVFVKKLRQNPDYENLTDSFCQAVIKAAPMHDLGKIAVDDAILRKPGKFTDEEYEKMKSHSAEGARIVETVLSNVEDQEFKQIAINVAHYHHEKWNGSGYPEKIAGEAIPFEARIMALADVFDALVSKRCYKDSFSYDKAFQIIEESLGSHFDPELGKIFIQCRPELQALYEKYN